MNVKKTEAMLQKFYRFMACLFLIIVIPNGYAQTISEDEILDLLENRNKIKVSQLPDNPSLNEYVQFALINNSQIRAAFAGWKSERARIPTVKGLPDLQISMGYFLENIETAVGPQKYRAGITQMIPWPGKLKVQGDIQSLKADAAYEHLKKTANEQIYQLKLAYYDYYLLERSIDITQQNLDLVKQWERVVLSKYKTSTAQHPDLIKAQIEAIKLDDDLHTLKFKRKPLIDRFMAILNVHTLEHLHVPDSLLYRKTMLSKDGMEETIINENPGLKEMQYMHKANDKSVTRAKLNWLPDLSIGVDYINTGDKWNAAGDAVPESGKDPLMIRGSISFPLWAFKQAGQVRAARENVLEAGADVIVMQNNLHTSFENAYFSLEEAERKIRLYRERLIPKSLESLRATEKAYIGDQMGFLSLVDTQQRHLMFTLALERSLVNYYKASAQLDKMAGRSL